LQEEPKQNRREYQDQLYHSLLYSVTLWLFGLRKWDVDRSEDIKLSPEELMDVIEEEFCEEGTSEQCKNAKKLKRKCYDVLEQMRKRKATK